VDDTVNALITIMNLGDFGPYNVGTEVELEITEIARAIIHLIPETKGTIAFKQLPVDDPKQRRPVLTKINALGWQSRVTLSLGLTKTIEYFRGKI
jgi:nucleoside-diphosphate-sugar epimerase